MFIFTSFSPTLHLHVQLNINQLCISIMGMLGKLCSTLANGNHTLVAIRASKAI